MPQFPSTSGASDIWTVNEALRAEAGDNWPLMISPPGAPTGVSATAGDASATVSFTAPASNGGSAITGYRVTSSPGGLTATGASSPITITGLTNGTAYTFTVAATNSVGYGTASAASNSVTPVMNAWNEAGTGSTTTALKNNLLFAGLGNTVYQYYNVASLVKNNTNPKSVSGLPAPINYSGQTYNSGGGTHGMDSSAPTQFSSANGYGTNAFHTAKASAPGLHGAWSGSPNPGIACMWYVRSQGGLHFIGNADCTSRYLLDNNPSSSSWTWIVVDIYNNNLYWNGVSQGSAGGSYTSLFCAYYMGWTNSNTIDGFYHDYRVYQYDSSNHTAMVNALLTPPSTSYYTGGV